MLRNVPDQGPRTLQSCDRLKSRCEVGETALSVGRDSGPPPDRRPVRKALLGSALAGTLVVASTTASRAAPDASPAAAQQCSVQIDIQSYALGGAKQDPDVARLSADIDKAFAAALKKAQDPASLDPYHQMRALGELGIFDKNLSVGKNLACSSCHAPDAGFTGGVSLYNQTIVAQPGSVTTPAAKHPAPDFRIAARKPQSYGYAPFSPILEYDAVQKQFTGGNFWDMRATGFQLGNPAAEQARGPPTNPLEMGLSDPACAVHRLSQSSYRGLFELVWGAQSFAINWPANVETVCATPGPPPAGDPLPVHLSAVDRGTANSTFDHLAMSIAAYEASPDVSPFSSKFDYAVAHPQEQVLSREELAGWELFRGKGKCNSCHLDGMENTAGTRSGPAASRHPGAGEKNSAPLFSDFQPHNLGVPANRALPYYCETGQDQSGFVANPLGASYVDHGVGGFLASTSNPNRQWAQHAGQFEGTFQTPTLRNVDKRPRPDFVKAYMHNGYFKSLKQVVHFYNTRDVLPRCADPLDPRAGTACWPAAEVSANESKTLGHLGLSDQEENAIVDFLKTLTDGYARAP